MSPDNRNKLTELPREGRRLQLVTRLQDLNEAVTFVNDLPQAREMSTPSPLAYNGYSAMNAPVYQAYSYSADRGVIGDAA